VLARSIELRKVKTLGPRKVFRLIKPGDYLGPLSNKMDMDNGSDDATEDVVIPAVAFPSHEPLVLWRSDDSDAKIEVSIC
jgi:hypothetical protein